MRTQNFLNPRLNSGTVIRSGRSIFAQTRLMDLDATRL
jgi:hypothetical protein